MKWIAMGTTRAIVLMTTVAAAAVLLAHDMTYVGTVARVETARLHVRTVDTASKKEQTIVFSVTKDTKVRRGTQSVSFAEARIVTGERVAVVVNHDAAVKNVATEVRLAAK